MAIKKNKGKVFIISGPSRSGKDSVVSSVLNDKNIDVTKVVTYTTREQRSEEREKIDHYFVSETKFKNMIAKDAFLEWAPVRHCYFGTPKKEVNALLSSGKNILLKIDVRGKEKIEKSLKGFELITIFLKPSKFGDIKRRMIEDDFSLDQMKIRLAEAKMEIEASKDYDYIVINREGELEKTISKVKNIILSKLQEK